MKNAVKKALSIMLVAVMLFGAAPLGGFAGLELPDWLDFGKLFAVEAKAANYNGECGDNLTWSLSTTSGELKISGTGAMYNYSYGSEAPWYSQRSYIKSVYISDGVTTIGDEAFLFYAAITSVTMPSSIKTIGQKSFMSCYNLKKITIPNGVITIGDHAFDNCILLTNITIPQSVTAIGEEAFSSCAGLERIAVDRNNNYFSNDDYGVLFNKNKTVLIQYPAGNPRSQYTVPYGVITIGNRAFESNKKLTNIEIPDGVQTIGEGAFDSASNISKIVIPPSVTSIGATAFRYCNSLVEMVIPDSVKRIGFGAFGSCQKLKSVIIRGEDVIIGNGIFNYCPSLEYVHISSETTEIGEDIFADTPSAFICSTSEESYVKTYADKNGIEFKKCNGHRFAVFSTDKSFTVKPNESMSLAFGTVIDGQIDGEWKKMAITVSDPTVIALSDYTKTEYGYALEVIGKKEGVTNLVVTDAETGANIVLTVTVDDSFVKTYSYAIDSIPSFYPGNKFENNIQTNIYNLNGIYINNYQCTKSADKYEISFDAFNEMHHHAAVDIYDADGNWIGAEKIDKYDMMTSVWDTGEDLFYMFADWEWLSYTHNMHSQKSKISFEVPDGGYFEISNNYAESAGCFFYNTADIFFEAVSVAADVFVGEIETPILDSLMDEIEDNKSTRELFIEIFEDSIQDELGQYTGNLTDGSIDSSYSGICGTFENMLGSLEIDWKHLFSSATGIGESVLKEISGPAGLALDGCFAISESTNKYLQAMNIKWSVDEPYICVYSDIEEGYINPHGVIVNTNGNVDAETVLQVFRISNDDSVKVILDSDNPLEMHELYNISFVKDDKNVQPNGKVKVHVPIPEGMDSNTSKIYRQEADGSWTVLNAKVEGNYLVFETDHFSLYAIIGDKAELKIASLPDKLTYTMGDTLDSTGLSLELNGNVITSGFICDSTVIYNPVKQTITVHYAGLTAEFDVKVNMNAPEISVPSTTTVNYGDTLILNLGELNLPKGYFVEWSVNGNGVKIQPSTDGTQCKVTSVSSGTVTVTAKIVDKDGKPVTDEDGNSFYDEITLKSNAGFFQKLISFFKNLFGISRTIVQSIYF